VAHKVSNRLSVLVVAVVCLGIIGHILRWRPFGSWTLFCEIAAPATIVALGFGLGGCILHITGMAVRLEGLERLVHALAVGLGGLVLGVLILGLAGLLSRLTVLGLLTAAGIVSLSRWRILGEDLASGVEALKAELSTAGRAALGVVVVAALLVPLAASVLPEAFYDSLLYHLEAPEIWLEHGRLAAVPTNLHLNYPVNTSALYLATRCLAPSVSAGTMHWFFLFATALALISVARPAARGVGVTAAALFVVTPSTLEVAGYAAADLSTTFWCVAAFAGWLRWVEDRSPAVLVLVGCELGLAVGAKYTAILVAVIPLVVMTLLVPRGRTLVDRLQHASLIGLAAVICFSPWLVRNGFETGNPLYPYFFEARGEFAVEHSLEEELELRMEEKVTPGRLVKYALSGPIELVRDGVGAAPMVGPVLLLPLLLLLTQSPLSDRIKMCLLISAIGFIGWDVTVHVTRYAFPFLALLAVPAATALVNEGTRWRRIALGVVVGCGLAHNLVLGWLASDWGSLRDQLRGVSSREEYIAKYISYYRAVDHANRHLGRDDRIIFVGEARGFYCQIPCVTSGPAAINPLYRLAEEAGGRPLGPLLLERGYTDLLISRSEMKRLSEMRLLNVTPPSVEAEQKVMALLASGTEVLFDDGNVSLVRILSTEQTR
jgi:hypothetical protein